MKKEYLTFEQCLDRLEHSFIRITGVFGRFYIGVSYFGGPSIDFQHPSLRDMLLRLLQNDPTARYQYILLASPEGLSNIISGVPFSYSPLNDDIHTLVIQNEKELDLLCERIINVITDSTQYYAKLNLLNSAEKLLPHRGKERIGPSDIDIEEFLKTPSGKVLNTLLKGLADRKIYENNLTYNLHSWVNILEKFYQLTPYINPIPHPSYLFDLSSRFEKENILDDIRFIDILHKNEPIIYKQVFSQKLAQKWNEFLISELIDCFYEGEDCVGAYTTNPEEYEEKSNAYENWNYNAEELLETANAFYSLLGSQNPDEFCALQKLYDTAVPPEEPEIGYTEEDHDTDDLYGEHWTIEEMFEDL